MDKLAVGNCSRNLGISLLIMSNSDALRYKRAGLGPKILGLKDITGLVTDTMESLVDPPTIYIVNRFNKKHHRDKVTWSSVSFWSSHPSLI